MAAPKFKTHPGVLDPTIPQLEQCVQVGIGVEANRPGAKPKLYPHTVMLKHHPDNTTMVLSNGRPAPSDVRLCSGDASQNTLMDRDITPATHEFAGVALSGVTNPEVAKSYPDSAGRLSVQRHGIATLFALVVEKKIVEQAKYGAVVFVHGAANAQARSHIYGFEQDESFWPYEIHVDGCGKTYDRRTDLKIGHLVQLPPRDRNDIRVWIRPDDAQPGAAAAANPGDGNPKKAAPGGGSLMTFDVLPAAPTEAEKAADKRSAESGKGSSSSSSSSSSDPEKSAGEPSEDDMLERLAGRAGGRTDAEMDGDNARAMDPPPGYTTGAMSDRAKRPAESDGAGPAPSKSKKASKKR